MRNRQQQILLAIIDNFIRTAVPVGSKTIVTEYEIKVSGATVRNEMHKLEEEGLICSPHTSAGRVPTEKGYRFFMESVKASKGEKKLAERFFSEQRHHLFSQEEVRQKVYGVVDLMAKACDNVSFATLPGNTQTIFLGLSNVLRKPEFISQPEVASQVVEVLERDFISVLSSLDVDDEPRVYIGQENVIPAFSSCSMIVSRYTYKDMKGVLGILGPMRMRYSYNIEIVSQAGETMKSWG